MPVLRMDGVFLNGEARNALWKRLQEAMRSDDPQVCQALDDDEIPRDSELEGMVYYSQVTAADYGGANPPAYEGYFDGEDLYLEKRSWHGGFGTEAQVEWFRLSAFEMPDASPPSFW